MFDQLEYSKSYVLTLISFGIGTLTVRLDLMVSVNFM